MSRKITIVISILIALGGVFGYKYIIDSKEDKKPPVPKSSTTVYTKRVQNKTLPLIITESGRLVAKRKALIYSEVQGVMVSTSKLFKAGVTYKKGELMVKIRSSDSYAQLQAQKSVLQNLITSALPDLRIDYPDAFPAWNQYVANFEIDKPIEALPKVNSEKEKYFITGKNIYTTYYNTKNLEIIQSKYNLRAPYNGILTQTLVNPGTVIRQGQQLGEFIDPSTYELEIAVSQSLIGSLTIGKEVKVIETNLGKDTWIGKISRINGKVDATTQTVAVFIELKGNDLKEGLYLTAYIEGEEVENVVEVDRKLLVNGSKLFTVTDSTLALTPVSLVHKTESTVIISGLPNNTQLVSKIVPGAYQGMTVKVLEEK